MESQTLISIKNCRIENSKETVVPEIDWQLKSGEKWLVIGPNGGGKAVFLNALSGIGGLKFVPNPVKNAEIPLYSNLFADSTEIVSLERAARLIQEERENDESDFMEEGVDIGRTGRVFISDKLFDPAAIDDRPEIELTGVKKILDRGLKYMSTGEIRRTLLARALMSGKKLLILSDPFAGLDAQSRTIIFHYVNQTTTGSPSIILGMERWHEIPDAITHVLEFRDKQVSYCGERAGYEALLKERGEQEAAGEEEKRQSFKSGFEELTNTDPAAVESRDVLVEMNDVNVGWDGHQVLRNLNWKLVRGEHWLVRGPNGSGKTTFLELITGDNMQVFSNDVRIFGNRRGSGETIWDIKKRLGIVSYRLHVEYRMLGGTSLLAVIISGFRDSIGLYDQPTDSEIDAAKKWLALGGFAGRESENFGNLSYGEQRAILILRSAVKTPEILILDEPCHGLDEQYRSKILQLMELIGNGGTTTMLHVTHDPSEVLPCEKHILELHPGEEPMFQIIVK